MIRVDFHFRGTASEEGELVSLGMNARQGPTATSSPPERVPHAGFSLSKPGAGWWRMGRARLSEMLGWARMARRRLTPVAPEASPPKVMLRAERAARASLSWRLRLDRPAPHKFDIALTLFVLLGAALLGAERGGQLDGVVTQASRAGDWVARSLGLGVAVVTVSGTTHMSEPRILAIAGIDASRSLPFFDVAEAKSRLEADPLIKQASVRKLYPTRSSSRSSSARPMPSGKRTET